jgi:hypothetical protein
MPQITPGRQAESCGYRAAFEVSGFKPFTKNTLCVLFDLEIVDRGMILRGCSLHERGGGHWIGWPARPYTKDDNKAKYFVQYSVLPIVLAAFAEESA